jgi:hypothetical protein
LMIFQQLQVCMHAGRLQAHGHVFSFFTRNLFRLAPDLLAILKQHGQAIDPNLQRLADAFQMVASKLGPDAVMAQLVGGTASGTKADEESGEVGTVREGGGVALVADDLKEGLQHLRKEMLLGDPKRRKRDHKRYAVGLMASRTVVFGICRSLWAWSVCTCAPLSLLRAASDATSFNNQIMLHLYCLPLAVANSSRLSKRALCTSSFCLQCFFHCVNGGSLECRQGAPEGGPTSTRGLLPSQHISNLPDFIPSPHFTGHRVHYAFKKDAGGQGYYWDERPIVTYLPSTTANAQAGMLCSSDKVADTSQAWPRPGKGLLGASKALMDAGMLSSGGGEDEDPVGSPAQVLRRPTKAKKDSRKALPGRLRKKLAREKNASG